MKIFAISDLHLSINNPKPMDIFGPVWQDYTQKIIDDWNKKVGDDDIVILAGDFSWAMKLEDAVSDFEFLNSLKGTKIMVRGNHDYWWSSISKVREVLPPKTYCLQNDAIKIGDFIFCGNRGWLMPEGKDNNEFNNKIFNRELIRLQLSLQNAKQLQTNNETIIYITHYPPFNSRIEESEFTKLISAYNVKTVIFGHLHGYINPKMYKNTVGSTEYFLTSCDALNNKLLQIY